MNVPSYDVAISFCKKQLPLAKQVADPIRNQCKVFIYTEHRQEMAGTDGELFLPWVFREESRIVVILHDLEWGTTDWTYIEERAIQDRARENRSHDFILLLTFSERMDAPLDEEMCPLLPKSSTARTSLAWSSL